MPGIILEGGTFRPIFSAGVMDALLDEDIMFPYMIGVSAGICDGFSYISKQKERNLKILMNHRNDKRYLGAGNLLKDKSLFGLDFVYDTIPNKLYPFDWKTFYEYEGRIRVGVTNAWTGKVEYKDGMKLDKKCMRYHLYFQRFMLMESHIMMEDWQIRSRSESQSKMAMRRI